MTAEALKLGPGMRLRFTVWAPERDLNPQYAHLEDVDPCGGILDHPRADGIDEPDHASGILFEHPSMAAVFPDHPRWTVEALDPLTLSPSILCSPERGGCGLHGYIREGRWVDA